MSASQILSLENLIKGYLSDRDNLKLKVKSQKEIIVDAYEQDREYRDALHEVEKAKAKLKSIKDRLTKTADIATRTAELELLGDEVKTINAAISDYLNQYKNLTQSDLFTGPDGEVMSIVQQAKLIKK